LVQKKFLSEQSCSLLALTFGGYHFARLGIPYDGIQLAFGVRLTEAQALSLAVIIVAFLLCRLLEAILELSGIGIQGPADDGIA
jgi:hypothetical protein